jgi:hypothetical protein
MIRNKGQLAIALPHSDSLLLKAAWEKITAFREVDVPKVRYLTVAECKRLIDACPADFKALVRAALLTGCRYGELTAMRVDAFNPVAKTIHVERSKSGKGRYIPLNDEGVALFNDITEGRKDSAQMFYHADGPQKGEAWEHSQQRYWMSAWLMAHLPDQATAQNRKRMSAIRFKKCNLHSAKTYITGHCGQSRNFKSFKQDCSQTSHQSLLCPEHQTLPCSLWYGAVRCCNDFTLDPVVFKIKFFVRV